MRSRLTDREWDDWAESAVPTHQAVVHLVLAFDVAIPPGESIRKEQAGFADKAVEAVQHLLTRTENVCTDNGVTLDTKVWTNGKALWSRAQKDGFATSGGES